MRHFKFPNGFSGTQIPGGMFQMSKPTTQDRRLKAGLSGHFDFPNPFSGTQIRGGMFQMTNNLSGHFDFPNPFSGCCGMGDLPEGVDVNDYNKGLQLLQWFHNRAMAYPAYSLTFEQLKNFWGAKSPWGISLLGLDYTVQSLSDSTAQAAMEAAADAGRGSVPSDWQGLHNGLSQYLLNPSVWDAIGYTASETGKVLTTETAKIAKDLYDTAGGTLWAAKWLPYLAIGLVGAVVLAVIRKPGIIEGLAKKL